MSDDSSKPQAPGERQEAPAARGVLEGFFVPLLCIIAASLLFGIGIGLAGIGDESLMENVEIWASALIIILPAIFLGIYVTGVRRLPLFQAFKITRPDKRQLIKLLQGIGLYMLLSFGLLVVAQVFFTGFDAGEEQDLGLTSPETIPHLAALFIVLALLTPVSEELLFRGFMFPGMARTWGWLPAALVSSVLFGLLHGQINVMLDTAAMGFISAHLRHTTGSLTPSIMLHSIKNGVAFALVYALPLVS